MLKRLIGLALINGAIWTQCLNPALAAVVPAEASVRLSVSSSNPFPTPTYTNVTQLFLTSGPIELNQNGGWVPYEYVGATINVANTSGDIRDVWVLPGTTPGTVTYQDAPWTATQTQGTVSSATAAAPCVLTLSATVPSGITVGSQVMVTQGTGTGTLYTDSTYGLSGARNNIFTVGAVSGSTLTLTGSNTTTLSVSGAAGGVVTLIPTSRTNITSTYIDGIQVQSANHAARLIGTYMTGAGGVQGSTEFSSVRQWVFNQKDAAQANNNNFVYNAVGATQVANSTISSMVNNLCLYTQSGLPYADDSGSGSSTLYVGGRANNVQTFYDGVSTFYNEIVPQTVVTMSGNTTGTPVDVYVKGGGAGTNTVTVSQVAWTNATTPPATSTDPAGRLTMSGNTAYLLVGAYNPISATTTQDDSAARYVSNVLAPIPKKLYAADTTQTYTTTSSTFAPANGNTTNGVGRFSYLQRITNLPVNIEYQQGMQESNAAYYGVFGLGINSTSVTSSAVEIVYTAFETRTGNFVNPAAQGLTYIQKIAATSGGTLTFCAYQGGGTNSGALLSFMSGEIWN